MEMDKHMITESAYMDKDTIDEINGITINYEKIASKYGFDLRCSFNGEAGGYPNLNYTMTKNNLPFEIWFGCVEQAPEYMSTSIGTVIDEDADNVPPDNKWEYTLEKLLFIDGLHNQLKKQYSSFTNMEDGHADLFYHVPTKDTKDMSGVELFLKQVVDYVKNHEFRKEVVAKEESKK